MQNLRTLSFLVLCFALVANSSAAGLGFNPFEKTSPTSPSNPQKDRPTGPSPTGAPKSAPSSPAPAKPVSSPMQNQANQQQKK